MSRRRNGGTVMKPVLSVVRRAYRWSMNVVDSIRHGEDDMRAIYGDHPNGSQSPEQIALEASVAHNISNLGAGGLG